jgi:hypothetical protein
MKTILLTVGWSVFFINLFAFIYYHKRFQQLEGIKIFLLGFLCFYLCWAFILMELCPAKWLQVERAGFSGVIICWAFS